MKKARLFIGGIGCLLALFAGCRDEGLVFDFPDAGAGGPVHAVFRLDVACDEGVRSRAGGVHPADSTPGHAVEHAVNRLYVFAVPVSYVPGEGEREMWELMVQGSVPVGAGQQKVEVAMMLDASGETNVYVGANLSDAQAEAFAKGAPREYAVQGDKYYQAINEFAPFITKEPEANRRTGDIAMFCREAVRVNTEGVEKGTEGEDKVVVEVGTVHLKRMVAKVLVTCEVTEEVPEGGVPGVQYVPLKGDLHRLPAVGRETSGDQGWIRQGDVYYFVNNMPRRTRFMLQYDKEEDGTPVLLPHYNLREMLDNAGVLYTPVPLVFNVAKVKEHFIHYDMHELYRRNSSFQRSAVWDDAEYGKLVGNGADHGAYGKKGVGMYTLENLFGIEEGDFTVDQLERLLAYNALPIITHVSIAAKFTPRYIYVTREEWSGTDGLAGGGIKEQTLGDEQLGQLADSVKVILPDKDKDRLLCLRCANEAVANAVLTHSLRRKGKLLDNPDDYVPGDRAAYPKDTYFAYHLADDVGGGIAFCSYGTAVSFVKEGSGEAGDNTVLDKTMVPYTQGWGYYYTYINNRADDPIDEPGELKDAVVERNCYYVLRVRSIGAMGASVTDPNYIQVHTLRAGWQDGGRGEITLH